ncbi:MAG: MBL fold metallo-hydrolase, partial [Planctomycetaceae bacterium]|nr:MBL fold metallo-hydrolase [Planctomycetaceae bacterium]
MIRAACQSLLLCVAAAAVFGASRADAGAADKRLDIYFIDVEGGAATLLVTPAGESILIDSGYPDNQGRDLNRILHVVRDVAKLKGIDHAAVTHWHRDHYGNHAALAAEIKIGDFYDRGIPDALPEDPEFTTRIADYRRASQNQSRTLRAGDDFDLDSPSAPLNVRVITADRQVVANTGKPNPFADRHVAQAEDTTDNAASLSLLFTFGQFKFLCCGDLTWNVEAQIVTPNNPIGQVDLFMVTHHGLEVSNNPALVLAIDPVVAVMCNGPSKGGHANTQKTLREVQSLKALYQLHRNLSLADDQQTPAEFIANGGDTAGCEGVWVKASVAPDGKSYTVQIGEGGTPATYE